MVTVAAAWPEVTTGTCGQPARAYAPRQHPFDAERNSVTMDWLKQSIMRRRGVAQGRKADLQYLTEAPQGRYHATIGPNSGPVLQVHPGDHIVVEARNAFEGKVKTELDLPSRVLEMPFVNPQNGPILVAGAEKGDVLAVYIETMATRSPNPRGTCAMIPQFGALSGTAMAESLDFNDPVGLGVHDECRVEVLGHWGDNMIANSRARSLRAWRSNRTFAAPTDGSPLPYERSQSITNCGMQRCC